MNERILLVEDETSLAEPLRFLLENEGFSVEWVSDGALALEKFHATQPDIVLLDLMLPGRSGLEICQDVRAISQVPIIMLTAKDSELDIVLGLEFGADDYVTKPYSSRELLARIRAVLRRQRTTLSDLVADSVIEVAGIRLDAERHELTVRGVATQIPLREFELLELLMQNAGRVLTRAQIIDRIWGSDYFGDTKTLDVHVKRIRSRIERDPAEPELITTVRGVGYRFESE